MTFVNISIIREMANSTYSWNHWFSSVGARACVCVCVWHNGANISIHNNTYIIIDIYYNAFLFRDIFKMHL